MLLRPPGPVPGPDAQHAVLEQLRKAEYHRQDPSFVSRIWNWALDRLDSLFSGSTNGNALLILLVILAAAVIFAVVRSGPPSRGARRARQVDGDPLSPVASTDHRRLALEFAAAGRRAEALREWLRAAVQTIEARGVLTARPGRTGAATAREAGPLLPTAAADLRAATSAFDEVWFGGRAATDADVAAARAAADGVRSTRIAEPATVSGIRGPAVTVTAVDRTAPGVRPAELVRPGWRRARLWIAVAAVLVVGGFLAAELRTGSDRALDTASSGRSGSKALATVLDGYGVHVRTTTDLASARGRVVVTDPDAYSTDQLRRLDRQAELVLLAPSADALDALALPVHPLTMMNGPTDPLCDWPGATAAGSVDLPDGTLGYAPGGYASTAGGTSAGGDACYRGAVVRGDGWVVLGSASLLRNDHVGDAGVAALDVNAITADRTVSDVTWLLTGTQARSSAAPTTWTLFPDGARRAFIWLAAFGVLLVLWQAPRFGRVVTEPLPVVVRSAEVIEGHGRLYLRAGARDRAAAALRAAARQQRLASHLGLRRDASVRDVVDATAARVAREPSVLAGLLDGPVPREDGGLLDLALALDELERAAGVTVPQSQDLSRGTPT